MIKTVLGFVKKELNYVHLKKLEQLQAELEYEISLSNQLKHKGGMWFTKWNEQTLKLDQVKQIIKTKKEMYNL
jgi:hypothetical protein